VTDDRRRGTLPPNEGGFVSKTLPKTRPELIALHMAARRRRAAAELGSEEYRAACEEIATIEVRIAEIEQPARAASS
jgi:transcription elongation GreA/GreB family factor